MANRMIDRVAQVLDGDLDKARQVLEAMIEPSDEINPVLYDSDLDIYWSYRASGPGDPSDAWREMIKAILASAAS